MSYKVVRIFARASGASGAACIVLGYPQFKFVRTTCLVHGASD